LCGKEYIAPTEQERISLALRQLCLMVEAKGERIGIAEGKKHIGWYISGMNGAASARNRIMSASSLDEIKSILDGFLV
jgi:tRNA-dihydrouridine synthase